MRERARVRIHAALERAAGERPAAPNPRERAVQQMSAPAHRHAVPVHPGCTTGTGLVSLLLVIVVASVASSAWAEEPYRCIKRTHRTIVSAALAMERGHSTKGIDELRKAIVRNTGARIALAKKQDKTAMFLTLEGRRIARELLASYGETNNKGFEADPAESDAAAGGEGKDADAAVAEAEKMVPPVAELKKQIPDVDGD
jgi:hypothetical protein